MKVFITKYALTSGIIEKEVTLNEKYPNMVSVKEDRWITSISKPHWHETKQQALKQCEEMRIKKLQSLEKQMKKISSLKF